MINSYRARITAEHIDWLGMPPVGLKRCKGVDVEISILSGSAQPGAARQGKKLADILSKLAALDATSEISDPVSWQRDLRTERTLPGRED